LTDDTVKEYLFDSSAPKISEPSYLREGVANAESTISVSVEDQGDSPSGIYSVALMYAINEEAWWPPVAMSKTGANTYSASIPAQPEGTLVQFKILAEDATGNKAETSALNYTVGSYTPPNPNNPSSPFGSIPPYALAIAAIFIILFLLFFGSKFLLTPR
ncbi:MAG: hypothetical protein ABIH99_03455, partial [Candidatus Micrarchaeota archaeon]